MLPLDVAIVAVDSQKHDDQQRNQNHHDPGTFQELGRRDDNCDKQRRTGTQAIDEHTALPAGMATTQASPMEHHAALRERKR